MRALVLLLALLAFAPAGWAIQNQPSVGAMPLERQVALTLEERMALRLDPDQIKARNAEAQRRGFAFAGPDDAIAIYGSISPELYTPSFLFDHLLFKAFLAPPDFRSSLEEKIGRSLDHRAFLDAVENASSEYVGSRRAVHEAARSLAEPTVDRASVLRQIDRLQEDHCRMRAEAVRRAAAAVGEGVLLRVLYEYIAPSMATVITGLNNDPDHQAWVERGCP